MWELFLTMKRVAGILRLGWQFNEIKVVHNFVPRRGARFRTEIEWVRPKLKPFYDPSVTGDLAPMPPLNESALKIEFRNSEKLKTANELVKKAISLGYQSKLDHFLSYEKEMKDRVRRHPFDNSTREVKLASMTARIRWYQACLEKNPLKSEWREKIKHLIDARTRNLRKLRLYDYPKFEWLLEKLDLVYKPSPRDTQITRKKSLTLLAKLTMERQKEERIAALKQSLDEQKLPFLEKKLQKLKWIKEAETKHKLTPTVTDADIEECIKKMEEVKIVVAERKEKGYVRKIHPFFLEAYDERLLLEKEKPK